MQIGKIAQTLNTAMVYYGALFIFMIALFLLQQQQTPISFILFLLLLPSLGYFLFEAWKRICHLSGTQHKPYVFSWKSFFLQENLMFVLTLVIYIFIVNIMLVKKTEDFLKFMQNKQDGTLSQSNTSSSSNFSETARPWAAKTSTQNSQHAGTKTSNPSTQEQP